MEIVERDIDSIKPYDRNPRKNDEAVDLVANSIKEFGFKVPIVIDGDGIIVAGHTRYKAAKKLGIVKIPCIIADDLTDKQIKAYRLADNKVAEKAEWDFNVLAVELDDLFDFDMSGFGFDDEEEDHETNRDDKSDSINENVFIVIECETESELEIVFEKLAKEGYNCRLLTL